MMNSPKLKFPYDLSGHVALISGANHGIGAATAKALAGCGASVLITYLRTSDPEDYPEPYRSNRDKNADQILTEIRSGGGLAQAMEADLRNPSVVPKLFNFPETGGSSINPQSCSMVLRVWVWSCSGESSILLMPFRNTLR